MYENMIDKTVIITGGASGIDKETALEFAKNKVNVVIADLDENAGNKVVKELEKTGIKALFVKTDVSSFKDVKNLVETTIKNFGSLDFAFNNAGIGAPQINTADLEKSQWDNIININLNGIFYCVNQEIKEMLKRGGGVIVNTSSILGKVGFAQAAPYVAAKHGVLGLTKTAAIEYAQKGIRVNAVCPGFIETSMLEDAGILSDKKMKQQIEALHPIGRLGTPKEIAKAVVWLCSNQASFVTGEAFTIDGGYTSQ